MRPVIITIGLPIVIMQMWTLLNECPTLLVDQVVLTLLDGRCVVVHGVCCVDELIVYTNSCCRSIYFSSVTSSTHP